MFNLIFSSLLPIQCSFFIVNFTIERRIQMSEPLLMEMIDELKRVRENQIVMNQHISNIKETMATKEDVADIVTLKTDVSSMKEDISTLKTDMTSMKVAIIEILDTVKRVEATQDRHERTLDLLSRRSIEQEAEIKRIK